MKQQKTCDFCHGALDPLEGDLKFAHKGCWSQVQQDMASDHLLMEEFMSEQG